MSDPLAVFILYALVIGPTALFLAIIDYLDRRDRKQEAAL